MLELFSLAQLAFLGILMFGWLPEFVSVAFHFLIVNCSCILQHWCDVAALGGICC